MVLVEGNLRFEFEQGLVATQYDEWSFYRNQFQSVTGGTKAVDFLCIDETANTTWLIEVKDYRHPDANKITVSELGTAVAEKVRDTLAGLAAAKNNANDANERQLARQALRTATFRVVLHIEIPARFKLYLDEASLVTKLKQQIKAIDAHPKVVSQNTTLRANLGWTVTG